MDIPNTVTYIGAFTFMNFIGLTSIIIPDKVLYLGDHEFDGCYSLNEMCIISP
ncbi:leucine-rich repeat protein [Bacteroides sedimenti]|uniref:leucine-rich repeat protein n=1 Tax=Bacteroides sedimenti TaxID=2136147 RepID=UPI0033408AA1